MARSLVRGTRGAVLIETAFALPVLILFLFAIVTYGGWFAIAHAVQQSANEAARAALVGLTPAERAGLARDTAETALRRSYGIARDHVVVAVQDDGQALAVTVAYDASGEAMLALPIVPRPPSTIVRTAAAGISGL